MSWLQQCFGKDWLLDVLVIGALILFTLVIRILWRVQREVAKVDFADWLIGPDGKASWSKAQAIGGWMVGTFCMIYITIAQKIPDGYATFFLIYFIVVIGNPAAMDVIRRWRPLPSDTPAEPSKE